MSLSGRFSGSAISSRASTEENHRLVASEKLCRLEGKSPHRRAKIASHRNSQDNSKEMHVDRSYEQDNASPREAHLSFSKLSDKLSLASARHDVFAISLGRQRVDTETLQPSEAIREHSGHGHRFYTDRNDIQNLNSPS